MSMRVNAIERTARLKAYRHYVYRSSSSSVLYCQQHWLRALRKKKTVVAYVCIGKRYGSCAACDANESLSSA